MPVMKRTACEIICPIQSLEEWSFIKRRFKLTSDEIYVAIKVCQALSAEEIAARRNMPAAIIADQLAGVWAKTDTKSAIELLSTFLMALRWENDNEHAGIYSFEPRSSMRATVT